MLLLANNLHRRYGERLAVAGLNLTVDAGEFFGLLGPNGAGKSTAVRMLAGVLPPTAGSITVGGFDLVVERRRALPLLGMVPQELGLYPSLSAYANLEFWGRMHGLSGGELARRIGWAFELVALSGHAREPVQTFSGGMKRRLNLAAGILHAPRLLLLDEPTVGVDPQSRNRIFEGLEELNRRGTAVIYTSHYLEEVERLCHRVAVVEAGRVVAEGSPSTLTERWGSARVVLRVQGATESLPTDLRTLDGVRAVHLRDGTLVIETAKPQATLAAALQALARSGGEIQEVHLERASLESVFLALTGRATRDGGSP